MNDEFCKTYIPYGMYRSVERDRALDIRHPVRDASLTGCRRKRYRYIFYRAMYWLRRTLFPNGIQFQKFTPLYIIYFSFLIR